MARGRDDAYCGLTLGSIFVPGAAVLGTVVVVVVVVFVLGVVVVLGIVVVVVVAGIAPVLVALAAGLVIPPTILAHAPLGKYIQ